MLDIVQQWTEPTDNKKFSDRVESSMWNWFLTIDDLDAIIEDPILYLKTMKKKKRLSFFTSAEKSYGQRNRRESSDKDENS